MDSRGFGPRDGPRVAAVIGHADDADMLRRCIAHHLRIGVGHVFVSLNTPDAASERVTEEFAADMRVRAQRVEAFAPDPFHYFTAAVRVLAKWAAPDWVLFVDSDEFWIPARGRITESADLTAFDQIAVPRFNVPPLRDADGAEHEWERFDDLTPVVDAHRLADPENFRNDPKARWVMTKDHPKLMMRTELIGEVGRGAHTIVPRLRGWRGTTARDVLIMHVPFTTRERFRRKVVAIRERLATFGARFAPGEAWHWRRWLELDDAGRLDAEFDRQFIDAARLEALSALGIIATPRQIFARQGSA